MGTRLEAYKRMLYLRLAEEELVKLYLDKKLFSMVHFYIGQEAVAVGVCDALKPSDKVLGNHRSHGHYLAKGGNFRRMVSELLGKADGVAHGKGGSMHMIDTSVNFMGTSPVLGSIVPIAAGVAFEQKYNGKDDITATFFGDGASEEGIVYETYSLANLYKVPVLFVIENNLFAINSRTRERRPEGFSLEKIVTGFGLPYLQADGNDYEDVHAKAKQLVDLIRTEKRPAVLECVTYRHMAHSTPLMDEKYREQDVLDERVAKDSIGRMKKALLKGGVSEDELAKAEADMKAEIGKDIEHAQQAPFPHKDEIYKDMYYV